MRKDLFRSALLTMAAGLVLVSCSHEDAFEPVDPEKDYSANWVTKFGNIDPTQDWNSAVQAKASINLSGLTSQATEVSIYTSNPVNSGSRLLARKVVTGSASLAFDVVKSQQTVFVSAESEQGKILNGYFEIADNTVTIGKGAKTRSDWDNCDTQVSGSWQEWGSGVNDGKSETLYQLTNVFTEETQPWKVEDLRSVFGQGGVFEEGVNNVELWKELLSNDVEYVMEKTGPVTLQFQYMVTGGNNSLGYYFWKDGEDPAQAKKYVISEQGKALNNYLQVQYPGEGYKTPQVTELDVKQSYLSDDVLVKGTAFHLVYFDADGKASYDFPQGTHIAFFIRNGGPYEQIFNSIAKYNEDRNYSPALGNYDGRFGGSTVHAVTYQYKGVTFLGFEDWSDWDQNDLVFFATGDFTKPVAIPDPEPEPEPVSWIIACEDLGSTDDYDFNDVVFSVSHVGGQVEATVTPLAAGGTLSSNLYHNGRHLGEIHELIAPGTTANEQGLYPMLNTSGSKGTPGQPIIITVGADYTVSSAGGMGGFSIKVENTTNAVTISAPTTGEAPQMILVPDTWAWPTERTPIETAYPGFANWSQDAGANLDWYNNVGGSVVR